MANEDLLESMLRGRESSFALIQSNLKVFTSQYELDRIREYAELCMSRPVDYLVLKLPLCESPIERMLLFALAGVMLYPELQFPILSFRTDFAFQDEKIIIETDGHIYHSSKNDRARDASRDRVLTSLGWRVIRFTGSEIFRDARQCAIDISRLVRNVPLLG